MLKHLQERPTGATTIPTTPVEPDSTRTTSPSFIGPAPSPKTTLCKLETDPEDQPKPNLFTAPGPKPDPKASTSYTQPKPKSNPQQKTARTPHLKTNPQPTGALASRQPGLVPGQPTHLRIKSITRSQRSRVVPWPKRAAESERRARDKCVPRECRARRARSRARVR